MRLLLAGGRMRPAGLADRDHEPLYREALLVELDTGTGRMVERLSWRSAGPWDPDRVGHCFKGAAYDDDRLLLCTEREILAVGADFRVASVSSHRWFNDLHGVARLDGRLHVVSTGLDAVLELHGDEVSAVHPLGGALPEDRDYRAVSTKPHRVHPNHVFAADGRIWATRFHQADAVALGAPERRLPIGRPPHDGLAVGGDVWFTTVDGGLVRVDPRTGATRTVRLPRGSEPLGWCRGLWIDDGVAFVGFSRLRATTARRHLARLRGWLRGDRVATRLPTRVCAHDLATGALLGEWSTEDAGMHAIFAVLPAGGC